MRRILALALMLGTAFPAFAEDVGSPETFDFVALGDMPYNLPDDHARFDRLIDHVNGIAPEFTFHVGDIKSGSTPCSDEAFVRIKDHFARFRGALVYTPGDNEWTDCHRERAGRFDPLERLGKLRAMFFPDARSQGAAPLTLERQSDLMPEHRDIVENARFVLKGVQFATVHVVGSNNNFEIRDPREAEEFFGRDKANVAWINETFTKAQRDGAGAVVFAMQANMQEGRDTNGRLAGHSGYVNTANAIAAGAAEFGKPVLVVYGDSHVFDIGRMPDAEGKPLKNVFRLQVPGEELVEAVRVFVDPRNPAVFSFQLISLPENGTI